MLFPDQSADLIRKSIKQKVTDICPFTKVIFIAPLKNVLFLFYLHSLVWIWTHLVRTYISTKCRVNIPTYRYSTGTGTGTTGMCLNSQSMKHSYSGTLGTCNKELGALVHSEVIAIAAHETWRQWWNCLCTQLIRYRYSVLFNLFRT
jgi:hypothetical protein